MKAPIAQINTSGNIARTFVTISRVLLLMAILTNAFNFTHSQVPEKLADRRKTFGDSLKRFDKKHEAKKAAPEVGKDEEVVRVATDLVVTDVLVVNAKGRAIVGLKKDDFIVTEGGEQHELDLFSNSTTSRIPIKLVFIVELGTIPSMTDRSLEAAKILVDRLQGDDRMAIVSSRLQLLQDFTSDKKVLKSLLEKLKAETWAGRYEYSSLLAALAELFEPGDMRQVVVNQTYGGEFALMKPMWESHKVWCKREIRGFCERNFAFSDVISSVERSKATIYTVMPGPRIFGLPKADQERRASIYLNGYFNELGNPNRSAIERENFRRKWLEDEIASHTKTQKALIDITNVAGGVTDFLEKIDDAADIYGGISRMIENRYTLGFYPKNEQRDGKRRSIKIDVKGHPEYITVARKVYFAPEK